VRITEELPDDDDDALKHLNMQEFLDTIKY
jgi:hypothetical protein